MSRKKSIMYLITIAVPVLFILIISALYSLPLMLLLILLLIIVCGIFNKRHPSFFPSLVKPAASMPNPLNRRSSPLKHTSGQRTYMILISVNATNRQSITIDNSFFVIGRIEGCNFVLNDPTVSRHHLTIEYDEGKKLCFVTDTDSASGTFINSKRLTPKIRYELHQGDILQIANTAFSVDYYAHY